MNNNKRLLILGTAIIAVLVLLISLLFIKLSPEDNKEEFVVSSNELTIYNGVPSDAVAIFDIKEYSSINYLFNDTTSYLNKLLDKSNGLVTLQKYLLQYLKTDPVLYSLHYSAKNSVSLLQVVETEDGVLNSLNDKTLYKNYDNSKIYTMPNDLYITQYQNLLLASTSSFVLESAIRHLENKVSIIENENFFKLLSQNGSKDGVYINNSQIGKLFSGIISRDYLKYSDFFLKFSAWSYLELNDVRGGINLNGYFLNNSEKIYNSTVYQGLESSQSLMGKILPSSTIFAISFPITNLSKLLKNQETFWEVQKKLNIFNYKKSQAQGTNTLSPIAWVDSLKAEEVVSAFCKLGDKSEWITLIREKQKFGLKNVVNTVTDKEEIQPLKEFNYKGYMESVFGDIFSHCSEEYICKVGKWYIIGSKHFLNEFIKGSAYFFNLEHFIEQTPLENYLSKESSVKLITNLKEAGDSLLQIFKPYSKQCISNQLQGNNFEYLTLDILPDRKKVRLDINFYATNLEQLPKPKDRKDANQSNFIVDSTITIPSGPYKVEDVAKKTAAYLEQLPNNKLRYLDANKKGIWTVPFDSALCGFVEQIDLYENGRLQMLFLSGNKMYLLDRLGRFVNGFPKKLNKEVVLGPKLVRGLRGNRYSIMVLNRDNTYSWYGVDGKLVAGFKDIKVPEFVKELPEIKKFGGEWYWIVRAPSRLYLYNLNGEMLKLDKKKNIDRNSDIQFVSDGVFKVKGTDGREYYWDIKKGVLKRV